VQLFLILLFFVLQGLLAPLLSPWPPPDLLMLAALLPLGRRPLWQVVGLAYLLGLVQDMAGGGVMGLHALALAAGVFVGGGVLPSGLELSRAGLGWQLPALLGALAGKWAVMALLLGYLGQSAPVTMVLRVGPLEALLSAAFLCLLSPLLGQVARWSTRRLYG
jgi:hypothetical protein